MNEQRRLPLVVLTAVLATGLMIVLLAWAVTVQPAAASVEALRLDHRLIGEVELEWGTSGVFSDSEAIIAPTVVPTSTLTDLGDIALALLLQRDGSVAIGYVDLSNTLVFTGEHTLDVTVGLSTTQEMAGPEVTGTYGSSLLLTSELYSHTTQAGQDVQRQFWISGTVASGLATGEYRETIWGYGLEPLTLVGSFEMVVINSPTAVPTSVSTTGFKASASTVGLTVATLVLLLGLVTWRFRPHRKA